MVEAALSFPDFLLVVRPEISLKDAFYSWENESLMAVSLTDSKVPGVLPSSFSLRS